jgi:hypothetical protein
VNPVTSILILCASSPSNGLLLHGLLGPRPWSPSPSRLVHGYFCCCLYTAADFIHNNVIARIRTWSSSSYPSTSLTSSRTTATTTAASCATKHGYPNSLLRPTQPRRLRHRHFPTYFVYSNKWRLHPGTFYSHRLMFATILKASSAGPSYTSACPSLSLS